MNIKEAFLLVFKKKMVKNGGLRSEAVSNSNLILKDLNSMKFIKICSNLGVTSK